MEAFSDMKTPAYVLDPSAIRRQIDRMVSADQGQTEADRQTRDYYSSSAHTLVWVDRQGVDESADSLLSWLHLVGEIGLSEGAFNVAAIERDLVRMRSLGFDEGDNQASKVAARLEYQLTRACMRYCIGQRFGFVNPDHLLNNMDAERTDTAGRVIKYRGLFDIKMDHPSAHYASDVLAKVRKDSLAPYLRKIQPQNYFYGLMKSMLSQADSTLDRQRIMVNMERSRWRLHQPIDENVKRIVVNVPAYHLYAYNGSETLDMRVVCGARTTKTPLLSSFIEYMEVNPKWVIPMSIVENEVARRAGDSAYFARNRYGIYDRATNKQMPVGSVSQQMLLSGKYRISQEGGAGNSLGRIVFRFKNKFSVFLHDTSNPGAFQRTARSLSHGCVRVSKPFELAEFVLGDADEWLLDRIRIAMGKTAETERGLEYVQTHPDVSERNKLIGYVPVSSRVPLYIIYYTLWPDESGMMQKWPDIYGYDAAIWNKLKAYL